MQLLQPNTFVHFEPI